MLPENFGGFNSDGTFNVIIDGKSKSFKTKATAERAINAYNNRHLKENHKDRITLEGVHGVFAFYSAGYDKYTNKAPIAKYDNCELTDLIASKKIRYYPFLRSTYIPKGKRYDYEKRCSYDGNFTFLEMQDYPIIVLDADKNTSEQVKNILSTTNHCLKDYDYLIVPSLSGIKTHIIIWLDISHIERDQFRYDNNGAIYGYKNSQRYAVYCKKAEEITTQLSLDTGIVLDNNITGHHVAYNPEEIGAINEFFKAKSPSFVCIDRVEKEDVCYIDEDGVVYETPPKKETPATKKEKERRARKRKYIDELLPFLNEVDSMLSAFEENNELMADEIMHYVMKTCDVPVSSNKYYKRVLEVLVNNKEIFKDWLIENWNESKVFAIKEKDLGIGVVQLLSCLGLKGKRWMSTYLRRIFIYMLNLKIKDKYIYKKKTNTYDFIDEDFADKTFFSATLLKKHWWLLRRRRVIIPTAAELAAEFGGGNTWESIMNYTPFLVSVMEFDDAIELLIDGLDLSDANDKNNRRKDIIKFARFCASNHYGGD